MWVHHELKAWQEAMALIREVYQATASFPGFEQYRLASQLCRAAISVPSNIAEGVARESTKEFAQFLSIARGSLSELETRILIAEDLGYLPEATATSLLTRVDTVFALIGELIRNLRQRSPS